MTLLRMLSPPQQRSLRKLLALSSVEGAVTGLLLPLLNYAAVHELAPALLLALAGVYLVLLFASYSLRYVSGSRIAMLLDEALRDARVRIAGAIRAAELRTTERIDDLQTSFTRDIERIEELPYKVVDFLRYLSMLIGVGVYVLVLSRESFLFWLLLVVAVIAVLYPEVGRSRRITQRENAVWSELHTGLRDGLDGFKQLKLDPAARRSVARELEQQAGRLLELRLRRDFSRRNMEVRGSFVVELGIGAMLFVAPLQLEFDTALLFQLVTILFFTLGPATAVARELHVFVAAGVSLRQLEQLEQRLGDGRERVDADNSGDDGDADEGPASFSRLELRDVWFDYLDDEGQPSFCVGPIDLTIERGTLNLIRGGNGSGKTTLMKLLAGLYPPSRGSLCVDGVPVADELADYRERFTAIFSEHHLFERLYGLDASPAEVHELLARFKLTGVTSYEDGRFTSLDLSAGQRKRLAMVVALLERRPILLFDEWDAHQDPELRLYFYTELLPGLRAQGKTVIAVSHDDRYFDRADQLIHMVDGELVVPRTR